MMLDERELERARRLAAQHLVRRRRAVMIHDSWTADGDLKTSTGMNIATRPYSPADCHSPLSPLLTAPKLTLDWLPQLLIANMKSVCTAPPMRKTKAFDCFGSERLKGSIMLGAFGPRMLVATLRSHATLPSAVTVQLRGDRKHGLVLGHIDARLVAFIGAVPELRRDLRDLYRFLRYPALVKAALTDAKTRRNALEPFDFAGMPHSHEARLYAELWHQQAPGFRRVQSYARPVLKARL